MARYDTPDAPVNPTAQGAVAALDYQVSDMKVYPVTEDALSSLAKSDFLLSLGSSLATFFGGVLASLWITVSTLPQPIPDRVEGMEQIGLPLLLLFIGISIALMLWGLISRQTGIGRIKKRARSQTIREVPAEREG